MFYYLLLIWARSSEEKIVFNICPSVSLLQVVVSYKLSNLPSLLNIIPGQLPEGKRHYDVAVLFAVRRAQVLGAQKLFNRVHPPQVFNTSGVLQQTSAPSHRA